MAARGLMNENWRDMYISTEFQALSVVFSEFTKPLLVLVKPCIMHPTHAT